MIDACRRQGVLLLYAEELFFTPKYVEGQGNGGPGRLRQGLPGEAEREALRPAQRVVLGRGRIRRRRADGHGLPRHRLLLLVAGPAGASAVVYASWGPTCTATRPAATTTRSASSNSRAARSAWSRTVGRSAAAWTTAWRVYGEGGVTYANLHMGNALPTYSEYGYGYAVEKAPSTRGWSYPRVRGAVELRLSAGNAPLRALRARQGGPRPPARTGAWCWKRSTRPTRRPDSGARSRCPSGRSRTRCQCTGGWGGNTMIGAVDIGGTKIAVGGLDRQRVMRARRVCPTSPERGWEDALARMTTLLEEVQEEAGEKIEGIGIGCTGPVDPLTGTVENAELLAGWRGAPLVQRLAKRFWCNRRHGERRRLRCTCRSRVGAGPRRGMLSSTSPSAPALGSASSKTTGCSGARRAHIPNWATLCSI